MSDEEKKAIELLKQEPDFSLNYYNRENAIDIVLNLIEKQSKEIEHWKAGMKIIEKDKNNHIERLEKEIEELKDKNKKLRDKAKELIFEKQELKYKKLEE